MPSYHIVHQPGDRQPLRHRVAWRRLGRGARRQHPNAPRPGTWRLRNSTVPASDQGTAPASSLPGFRSPSRPQFAADIRALANPAAIAGRPDARSSGRHQKRVTGPWRRPCPVRRVRQWLGVPTSTVPRPARWKPLPLRRRAAWPPPRPHPAERTRACCPGDPAQAGGESRSTSSRPICSRISQPVPWLRPADVRRGVPAGYQSHAATGTHPTTTRRSPGDALAISANDWTDFAARQHRQDRLLRRGREPIPSNDFQHYTVSDKHLKVTDARRVDEAGRSAVARRLRCEPDLAQ